MKIWRPNMPGAQFVKVFLDDEEVERCVFCEGAANPGEEMPGMVAFFEVDNNGKILIDEDFEPVRKSKKGMVRWEWSGEESYAKYSRRLIKS